MPTSSPASLTAARLARIAYAVAASPDDWLDQVRFTTSRRWYARLRQTDDHEVWLLGWLPGQSTGFHDHGGSAGAFVVVFGNLEEREIVAGRATPPRIVKTGDSRAFGPHYVHDVRNTFASPAVSVHVYDPPLREINRFTETPTGLAHLVTEGPADW